MLNHGTRAPNVLIDYPPGGLGNFIAQIFTNSIDLNLFYLAYHSTQDRNYDDSLISSTKEEFLSKLKTWEPTSTVTIIHSFGTLDSFNFSGKVYQVVVEDDMISYILAQQIKTGAINGDSLKNYIEQNYGTFSNSTVRENYAYQYQYLRSNKTFINSASSRADVIISFDNFYKDEKSFIAEVKKINPSIETERLYEHFITTQMPIVERKNLYLKILDCIKKNVIFDMPNLSIIDQGILSGLLNELYPIVEWQLPNQEDWFTNTKEILSVINNNAR